MEMIITGIHEIKGKCRIILNDDPAFWLYRKEVSECSLLCGEVLSDEKLEMIYREIIGKRAKKYALKLLESRDYTCMQLKDKLKKADYPETVVEDTLMYVQSFHYIDDYRYACSFIEQHKASKSRQYLQGMLLGKGISSDTITLALENLLPDDTANAIQYWISKKGFVPEIADEMQTSKFIQFLMRKGFSYSDIKKQLQTYTG